MDNPETWPAHLPVTQLRIARPTDKLEEVVRFYVEGLGLRHLGGFEGHAGHDGVFIGLPGYGVHLEFTRHEAGSPCPAPTRDNLLVLYVPDVAARDALVARLTTLGYPPVEPENPYCAHQQVHALREPPGVRTRPCVHDEREGLPLSLLAHVLQAHGAASHLDGRGTQTGAPAHS